MSLPEHLRTTGGALRRWFIGTLQDALAVGGMWLLGLLIIGIPPWLALLWAVLGVLFQFVPNVGAALALIGPALTILFMEKGDWMMFIALLIVYAVIAVVDGLFLQPYFMRRSNKVPIWASLVTPIVLGILIPFWGVLLAGPVLAVIYTYKARRTPTPVIPFAPPPNLPDRPPDRPDQP